MNEEIRNLQPENVWNNFADLNAVPRPSKKEERVIAFMEEFGKKLELETITDKAGNVVIKKPASPGMENRKTVVLQSHLDMVHQKNNDTDFDFSTEGIKMYVDGDWVRARGTTLGADNGLGVATIMAILESKDIPHPPLEALFTIDEETGMTGAKNLDDSILDGEILLNLDTEEDDEIGIGCAGGVDITAERTYEEVSLPENHVAYKISVKGLNGGHSGMDIIKGLGNANKIMNRILYNAIRYGVRISRVEGGGLRNAIPRESNAVVTVDSTRKDEFLSDSNTLIEDIKKEYASLEENLFIGIEQTETPKKVMLEEAQNAFLKSVYAARNGIHRMSPEVKGLVETSNNIANITAVDGKIKISCLTRSSVESNKNDMANSLISAFELGGFEVNLTGEYPGWKPNPDSDILKVVGKVYEKQNGEKAHIAAVHAGLECGIIGSHYPKMDMVSFGPTIRGAHSPDERASISSVQKFWNLLLGILEDIPSK